MNVFSCIALLLLCLVAYVGILKITDSKLAWLAAELTGMGMVYGVCVYKILI